MFRIRSSNFTSHGAVQSRHQSHTAKSAKTFLTVCSNKPGQRWLNNVTFGMAFTAFKTGRNLVEQLPSWFLGCMGKVFPKRWKRPVSPAEQSGHNASVHRSKTLTEPTKPLRLPMVAFTNVLYNFFLCKTKCLN